MTTASTDGTVATAATAATAAPFGAYVGEAPREPDVLLLPGAVDGGGVESVRAELATAGAEGVAPRVQEDPAAAAAGVYTEEAVGGDGVGGEEEAVAGEANGDAALSAGVGYGGVRDNGDGEGEGGGNGGTFVL